MFLEYKPENWRTGVLRIANLVENIEQYTDRIR
jgi:hypothetical protein